MTDHEPTEQQIIGLLGACETQRGKRMSVRTGLLEYVCRRALTATALEKQVWQATQLVAESQQPHVYGPGLITFEPIPLRDWPPCWTPHELEERRSAIERESSFSSTWYQPNIGDVVWVLGPRGGLRHWTVKAVYARRVIIERFNVTTSYDRFTGELRDGSGVSNHVRGTPR